MRAPSLAWAEAQGSPRKVRVTTRGAEEEGLEAVEGMEEAASTSELPVLCERSVVVVRRRLKQNNSLPEY